MTDIEVGRAGKTVISLPLCVANRHGLVTGSTGTGKTVTLQRLAEQFSSAGVPVFAADVKGDLSGVGASRVEDKAVARSSATGAPYRPTAYPVEFWDIFGLEGLQIRTSVQSMGAELLARMLGLNQTQEGTLAIAFRKSEDDQDWMLTLDDLRWTLDEMLEAREDICKKYGNITSASISTIQRQILALESQGGSNLFGEPPFLISDLIRLSPDGRGIINLLSADKLLEAPKAYATFLLWLLTELFRKLPEVGDIDKPKIAFFFDEAHLLFRDAPPALIQQIERLVRLVRSKGVSVWMVTQSPADVPDSVLAQLGNRIQHALRAYTPKDQRMVRASAQAFRENRSVDVKKAITEMAVGEALVSLLDPAGVPAKVERVMISPPMAQIGPISTEERGVILMRSSLKSIYFYGAGEASVLTFKNRMRAERGLPEVSPVTEWQPGEFQNYLPSIPSVVPPTLGRLYYARKLVFWSSILIAAGIFLKLFSA